MSQPAWKPIAESDVKRWRKKLAKGHERQFNTGYTVGLEVADSDGDTAAIPAPQNTTTTDPEDPRRVVEDIIKQVVGWALDSPESARLAAAIYRNSNPQKLSDLTDEEVIADLINHYEEIVRRTVEQVYRDKRNQWDRGSNLDVQGKGIWLPSPTS